MAKPYSVYATFTRPNTTRAINTCYNPEVIGFNNIPHDYFWLRDGTCYARQQGYGG